MEHDLKNPPIVILTDFGISDPFVGIMKGVINQISPLTPIIDLSHEILPGDIRQAAVILWMSIHYFAPGSTFLVVVDPGVGTSRRPIILKNGVYTFIAPDNGVLSFVSGTEFNVWELSNPRLALPNPGTTFHGRDIFAPAAAHAALGVEASQFGDSLSNIHWLKSPRLESSHPGKLTGQILFPDRFGNLLTSLGKFNWLDSNLIDFNPWIGESSQFRTPPETLKIELQNGRLLSWVNTFANIEPGDCAVLIGNSGLLEIAANRQSAANLLNLGEDEPVLLWFEPVNTK
jgi:S-adenosyl-L-methionine hydrolase (adenosine-forming)